MTTRCGWSLGLAWVCGWSVVAAMSAQAQGQAQGQEDRFLVGGPLAGVKLPPNPRDTPSQGLPYGEWELYPGSVEHWREYMMKYCRTRSSFDAQSQVRRWSAADLAKLTGQSTESYAEPVYRVRGDITVGPTGARRDPVAVHRLGLSSPAIKLDLGVLDVGMYCLRIVAASEDGAKGWRKPMLLEWKLDDGVQHGPGTVSTWRRKVGYVDEFYSVEELFFHVTQKRAHRAELRAAEGSQTSLLVADILLEDALAGTTRRAIKTRMTLTTPEEAQTLREQYKPDRSEQQRIERLKGLDRLRRDEAIFRRYPPPQWNNWTFGFTDYPPEDTAPGLNALAFVEQHGKWEVDGWLDVGTEFTDNPANYNKLLINRKLGVTYSLQDLYLQKPLPEPFPFTDPLGAYFPNKANLQRSDSVKPLPRIVMGLQSTTHTIANRMAQAWLSSGDTTLARDGAVALIAYAYHYPALEAGQSVSGILTDADFRGRDTRFRQRHTYFIANHYPEFLNALIAYDRLFPYIQGNEELARSISRFIPWVQSSQELIQIFDTHLVQQTAKRIMRYHYHTGGSSIIAVPAAVLADPSVCDPWMAWLFTAGFTYPLPLAGIDDVMVAAHDRLGAQYIGSHFYAREEAAFSTVKQIELYRRASGTSRYDLSDPKAYHQPLASVSWDLGTIIGGHDFLRIGDVTGPEKQPGHSLSSMVKSDKPLLGWQWSRDPKFAWVVQHVQGRGKQPDAAWQEIQSAAASLPRSPWLDNRSRAIANWAGVLESGLQHDDYRFRRAVYVRAGVGTGHEHADTLDLQLFAHGLSFTPDDGQRGGYSKPNSRFSRIHNTVEVNGGNNNTEYGLNSYAWVRALTDAPDAPYMRVEARHPQAKIFSRQVSLLSVDEGTGSSKLPPAKQIFGAALPKDVNTANGYVFDVFRVSGGHMHSYNFHGPVFDDFQWNVDNVQPVEHVKPNLKPATEAEYLSIFESTPRSKLAGDSPAVLQATWRYHRQDKMGSEQMQLQGNFNPALSPAFVRLHLLQAQGLRALRADLDCHQLKYQLACIMALKRSPDAKSALESAFPAIIEPFRGQPILRAVDAVTVTGNETDALRAVAVRVQTVSGHDDLCFADGRPEKQRQIGNVKISGEFAYLSRDAQGQLRQASLTGGTLLQSHDLTLRVAAAQRTATVVKVDYPNRLIWIDAPWPAASSHQPFEIGNPQRRTAYTASAVRPVGSGSMLTLIDGAAVYRSPITQVLPEKQRVDALLTSVAFEGGLAGYTVTNDDLTRTWKLKAVNGNDFTLDGPVAAEHFQPTNALRMWEYGVGDTLNQSTFVSLQRQPDGTYKVQGNIDCTLTLPGGKTVTITADQLAGSPLGVNLR